MAVGSSVANVGRLVSWEGGARRTDPVVVVQPGTHCRHPLLFSDKGLYQSDNCYFPVTLQTLYGISTYLYEYSL